MSEVRIVDELPVHALVEPYDEEPDTEPCGCEWGTPVQRVGDHAFKCTRCGHVES